MTVQVRLREWQRVTPGDPNADQLRGVHLDDRDQQELAKRLTESGVLAVTDLHTGIEIRAFAHVGRLQLGDLVITIEPKLATEELLRLVRYVYGLRHLDLFDQTAYATSGRLLQDLLVAQLHAEARELVERGLVRRYVSTAEPLVSPRGRIDMQRLAAAGGLVTGAIHCRHHPRSSDHLLNQVLFAGLQLAGALADDRSLRVAVRRLAAMLGEFTVPARLNTTVLDRANRQLNRLTAAYQPAIRLIELLYHSSFVSLDDETSVTLRGFLFDMNRFFQALLERFLTENLEGYEVHSEHGLTEMMRYRPGSNPRRRQSPRPRPDFMIARSGKVVTLLDAKYRDLWERTLPRDMLYQLSVYALSQPPGATAAILYPTDDRGAREAIVEIRDPASGGVRGNVALRPVVLSRLLTLVEAGPPESPAALARQLALVS